MTQVVSQSQRHWPIRTVGELATAIQYGYTAKSNRAISGPKYLRITDIQDDTVDWPQVPSCEIDKEDIAKYRLKAGDLVFARTGATVGKSYLIRLGVPLSVFASYLIRIRFGPEVDSRYVSYFFSSPSYWRQVTERQAGIGQPNVNGKKLAQVKLPVAPIEEQQNVIAEIEKQFSRLDDAVTNLKRIKANLKRYKAAVLNAAVEGRLVPTESEPVRHGKGNRSATAGDLPKGWVWSTLGELGKVIGGLTKNPKRSLLPRKLPYLRVANVYANELRLSEIEEIGVADGELEKLLVKKGDLLIVEGNGSPDQIGRVALWDGSIEPCVHQNHLIKVRLDEMLPHWALIWLLSPGGRREIERVTSSTSGLHTLSSGKVSRLPVPVPSLAEQHRIVAEVERRVSFIAQVEAQTDADLQRAARLRQSILQTSFASDAIPAQ